MRNVTNHFRRNHLAELTLYRVSSYSASLATLLPIFLYPSRRVPLVATIQQSSKHQAPLQLSITYILSSTSASHEISSCCTPSHCIAFHHVALHREKAASTSHVDPNIDLTEYCVICNRMILSSSQNVFVSRRRRSSSSSSSSASSN
jgi:hypothetical protein